MSSLLAAQYGNVKLESDRQLANGLDAHVKIEPESTRASPGAQSEDDVYEDAGDLDYLNSAQGVYLTRLPKFLWKNWSQLDDDQEIQLGTIRVEGTPGDVKRVCVTVSDYLKTLH